MKTQDHQQRLLRLLVDRGLVRANDLVRELGISRATLARWLMRFSDDPIVTVGKTRVLQYGLIRPITDLSKEIPLFRVNDQGQLLPIGKLLVLHANQCVVEPHAQIFEALPPELFAMEPQGFMGRAFAAKFATELNLSPRLDDWSNDHFLRAIARRGEDLPGNLIVGSQTAQRWQTLAHKKHGRGSFFELALQAEAEHLVGSSAGGERPKFSVLMGQQHKIIKFAGPLKDPVQRRWADLLICEALAAAILQQNSIASSNMHVHETGDYLFLEIERFDRLGVRGRRAYLSLAAVDDWLFGNRDAWSGAAERLRRRGLLSQTDADTINLIEAFSRLIGDTDRHFYNIGFFPRTQSPSLLVPEALELAPVFDKLPMLFAPVNGRVLERTFVADLPDPALIPVWSTAKNLATEFWTKVIKTKTLSAGFRSIARQCLKTVA